MQQAFTRSSLLYAQMRINNPMFWYAEKGQKEGTSTQNIPDQKHKGKAAARETLDLVCSSSCTLIVCRVLVRQMRIQQAS